MGMAGAVFGQRKRHAALMRADFVLLVAALVAVVAHKQHQVQVLRGHVAVRRKVALFVMLARGEGETQFARQRLRLGQGTGGAVYSQQFGPRIGAFCVRVLGHD